jgi:hypothetical protein
LLFRPERKVAQDKHNQEKLNRYYSAMPFKFSKYLETS